MEQRKEGTTCFYYLPPPQPSVLLRSPELQDSGSKIELPLFALVTLSPAPSKTKTEQSLAQ